MRQHWNTLLAFAAVAVLTAASAGGTSAQSVYIRTPAPNVGTIRPPIRSGGGFQGGGFGASMPGALTAIPQIAPPGPRQQHATRRGPSGVRRINERRLLPDEVLIEASNSVSLQQINALQRRHRLTRV